MDDIVVRRINPKRDLKRLRRIPTLPERAGRPRKKLAPPPPSRFSKISFSGNDSKRPHYLLWGVAFVALLILIISLSTIFEHATLKISQKEKTVSLDFIFTAVRSTEDATKIPYEVVRLPTSGSVTVTATESKNVERRASGTIIIFNDFNSYNQRLVKNTRFETPEGLIYRIHESVNVPGRSTSGEKLPGSLEVVIYADQPGEKYNISATDFTIPGFKGSPQFDGFYARSKTPMVGGFVGTVKSISESKFEEIKNDLREKISEDLMETIYAQKPDEFVLFDEAIFIIFDEDNLMEEDGGTNKSTIEIKQNAILYGIIFEKQVLSQHLAERLLPQIDILDRVDIVNIEDLQFNFLDKDSVDPKKDESISFSLKGTPTFVWLFDDQELLRNIAGRRKSDLRNILTKFPSIIRAEVVMRPFWKKSFPEKIEDFSIEKIKSDG